MLPLFLLNHILVASALSSSSQDCFSPPGPHHLVMELVEGVLEKRLDDWLGRIFGEEFPFLGTESDTDCSQGECDRKGMKLLGNFSGPFQIEVTDELPKIVSLWNNSNSDVLLAIKSGMDKALPREMIGLHTYSMILLKIHVALQILSCTIK